MGLFNALGALGLGLLPSSLLAVFAVKQNKASVVALTAALCVLAASVAGFLSYYFALAMIGV